MSNIEILRSKNTKKKINILFICKVCKKNNFKAPKPLKSLKILKLALVLKSLCHGYTS